MEFDSGDVIRLILQFLQEQGLSESAKKLQEESKISLNTVENLDGFISDISRGKWDNVLKTVASLALPQPKLAMLYEQIVKVCMSYRDGLLALSPCCSL